MPRSAAKVVGEPYHHGDLRRALLAAAGAIIEETGEWDVSLREVARRAGVSHNAPYRHFADREALLGAVGAGGFEALRAQSVAAAEDEANRSAADRLAAMGKAYIAFGLANPALYRLMFARSLPKVEASPATLRRVTGLTEGALRNVVEAGGRDGSLRVDPHDPEAVSAMAIGAWSQVHGLTLLIIDRLIPSEGGDDEAHALAGRIIDLFVGGLRA